MAAKLTDYHHLRGGAPRGSGATGMRVGVIGGSVAGCSTAALLHRAGHDVIVFERSESDLVSQGAGIGTPTTVWQDMMARGLIDGTSLPSEPTTSGMSPVDPGPASRDGWATGSSTPHGWSTGPISTSGFGGAFLTSCTAAPRPSS